MKLQRRLKSAATHSAAWAGETTRSLLLCVPTYITRFSVAAPTRKECCMTTVLSATTTPTRWSLLVRQRGREFLRLRHCRRLWNCRGVRGRLQGSVWRRRDFCRHQLSRRRFGSGDELQLYEGLRRRAKWTNHGRKQHQRRALLLLRRTFWCYCCRVKRDSDSSLN